MAGITFAMGLKKQERGEFGSKGWQRSCSKQIYIYKLSAIKYYKDL